VKNRSIPLAVSLYYALKPCLPRTAQLALRRWRVARQVRSSRAVWPIDPKSSVPPPGWTGWPSGKRFALVLTHDVERAGCEAKCRQLVALERDKGMRSSLNFVPLNYPNLDELRHLLVSEGFEVGVHGLRHDGNLFRSRRIFDKRAVAINRVLREWGAVGFRAPSMHHNLDWLCDLNIEYDASTFDTDPFEPQPDGVCSIFPFLVRGVSGHEFVELPYTLPQDSTILVVMAHRNVEIWKRKLRWIAESGGMALLNTHPDYMHFGRGRLLGDEYPVELYVEFLQHICDEYAGEYWHVLPRDISRFWRDWCLGPSTGGQREECLKDRPFQDEDV
jgi:hypothetical protein